MCTHEQSHKRKSLIHLTRFFITISDISLDIKIRLTKIILTEENNISSNIFLECLQQPPVHNYTPNSSKCLQSVRLIGVFFYTQVDDVWLRWVPLCSAFFREVVFLEDESYSDPAVLYIPTGCSWVQRYTWSFFFFFPSLRFPSTVPIFPSL